MTYKHSTTERLIRRRLFLTSAAVGGAGAFCTSSVAGMSDNLADSEFCGELSAADPLYLYESLVFQLQPDAAKACRDKERTVEVALSKKLEELWRLSDDLQSKLSRLSKAKPAVDRMNSIAYIGHANAQAVKTILGSRSQEIARAHAKSQEVITSEIMKASVELSQQTEKTLTAEEWLLLQQLLGVINEIKTIYHPAVLRARDAFDTCIETINKDMFAIKDALMSASRYVVEGDKGEALKQVDIALAKLKGLPSTQAEGVSPAVVARKADESTKGDEILTLGAFIQMVQSARDLISGPQRVPQISKNRHKGAALQQIAFVSPSGTPLPNAVVDPESVRAIVRQCFVSGAWWQVVGVTAACLPLWSAYNQSEQRKRLIYSALTAVPRGHGSNLWGAAYYLDRLLN